MTLTIPTLLTLFRIVTIPVMVMFFYWSHPWSNILATAVFVFGALTDWLDGWVARRFDMYSAFGAFLDPVADKLIVAVALVLIISKDPRWLIVLTAAIIIGREITISALREWMAEIGARRKVAVSQLGKYKTILQIVGLSLMLYRTPLFGLPTYGPGVALTEVAAAATLLSMVMYLRAAWPDLRHQT